MRTTHTYATLEVSQEFFEDVRAKLLAAGYQSHFHNDGVVDLIDMTGIALVAKHQLKDTFLSNTKGNSQ